MTFEYHFIKNYYFSPKGLDKDDSKILYALGILHFKVLKERETDKYYYIEERVNKYNPLWILFVILAVPFVILWGIIKNTKEWFETAITTAREPVRYGKILKQDVDNFYFPKDNNKAKENIN